MCEWHWIWWIESTILSRKNIWHWHEKKSIWSEKKHSLLAQLTFRMECFWPVARPHSSTVCNRPSTLRPRVVCFSQTHCHCRQGMCTDVVYGIRARLDCTEVFPVNRRIAIHGMKSPDFRRLFNFRTKEIHFFLFANEHEKSFPIIRNT